MSEGFFEEIKRITTERFVPIREARWQRTYGRLEGLFLGVLGISGVVWLLLR